MFGSLKNYLSGKTGDMTNANRQGSYVSGDSSNSSSSKSSSSLSDTLGQASSSSHSDHPGTDELKINIFQCRIFIIYVY